MVEVEVFSEVSGSMVNTSRLARAALLSGYRHSHRYQVAEVGVEASQSYLTILLRIRIQAVVAGGNPLAGGVLKFAGMRLEPGAPIRESMIPSLR
jgi:hypothetical protein